jgi:hypothetical protein
LFAKVKKSIYKNNKTNEVSRFCFIFAEKPRIMPSKNPFAFKAKQQGKKKSSGKRVGKSKPEKANNQLNRRVK